MRDTYFIPPPDRPLARLSAAAAQAQADTLRLLRGRRFGPVVVAGVAITGISGPFGTYVDLVAPLRMVYWALMIAPPAVLMCWLSFFWWRLWGGSILRVALLAWASALVPVWLLCAVLEVVFPFPNPEPPLALLPLCILPLLGVTLMANWFVLPVAGPVPRLVPPRPATYRPDAVAVQPGAASAEPAGASGLMARLPPRLGRELVSLNAQGHYLEVVTSLGRILILMPISQAEAELTGWPGMRVHRSWWVNLAHVRRASTRSGRLELELTTGQKVPVARTLVRQVRTALDRHGPPDLAD